MNSLSLCESKLFNVQKMTAFLLWCRSGTNFLRKQINYELETRFLNGSNLNNNPIVNCFTKLS